MMDPNGKREEFEERHRESHMILSDIYRTSTRIYHELKTSNSFQGHVITF